MDLLEAIKTISQFGGLVFLAGALVTGFLVPKAIADAAAKAVALEREKQDNLATARLADQKEINKELTLTVRELTEALRRMADAWEARNRAEADRRRASDA